MFLPRAFLGLLAAGLASAQIPDVPACSLNCFVSALNSDGCSSLTDFACHCQKPELISKIQPCIEKECNIADQHIVSNVVIFECSVAGHTIHLTPIVEKPTHHSTTTETTLLTATTTATETAVTVSSTDAVSSSVVPSSSPSHSTASPSRASTTTTSTSFTAETTSTTATESPSATPTTELSNDAGSSKGNMVGVAVMAVAALYML